MESIKNGIELVGKAGNTLYGNVKDIRPPHLSTVLTMAACTLPKCTAQDSPSGNSTGGGGTTTFIYVAVPLATVAIFSAGCCLVPSFIRIVNNLFPTQPAEPPVDQPNDQHPDLIQSEEDISADTQNSGKNDKGETTQLLDQQYQSSEYASLVNNPNGKGFKSERYQSYSVSHNDTEIQLFELDEDFVSTTAKD